MPRPTHTPATAPRRRTTQYSSIAARAARLALSVGLAAGILTATAGCGASWSTRTAPAGQWRAYRERFGAVSPTRGPADARVVIELFSDFQCPFCGQVRRSVDFVLQRHGSQVQLVWRDYPLPNHEHALEAAEAAREAFAQGGSEAFWRYHDQLFDHQGELAREDLVRHAVRLELDGDRMRAALADHRHRDAIRADIAAADASGQEIGTPSFFVNGRYVAGALPPDALLAVVEEALGQAR